MAKVFCRAARRARRDRCMPELLSGIAPWMGEQEVTEAWRIFERRKLDEGVEGVVKVSTVAIPSYPTQKRWTTRICHEECSPPGFFKRVALQLLPNDPIHPFAGLVLGRFDGESHL